MFYLIVAEYSAPWGGSSHASVRELFGLLNLKGILLLISTEMGSFP